MGNIIVVLPFIESSPLIEWGREVYRDVKEVDIVGIADGKDPLFTFSDVEYNIPGILDRVVLAEQEGYQAAIIGCFGDPGLVAARQMVSIPVIGPGESALAVASTLGDRIVIFAPGKDLVYAVERTIHEYGYNDKVVDVRCLTMPSEAIGTETEEEKREMAEMCFQAIIENHAHCLVLGCIGFMGFVEAIKSFFEEKGISCPIVEPGIIAMEHAKMMLRVGLNQSRMMF
jgi:allantoin racemase